MGIPAYFSHLIKENRNALKKLEIIKDINPSYLFL